MSMGDGAYACRKLICVYSTLNAENMRAGAIIRASA